MQPPLCRDCGTSFEAGDRCPACGSPRLLAHPELDRLTIAHVDCDAFYAAIEKRDDPTLTDKPVLVGGSRRGVVATCCYVARTYGVRSAMPMFKALKACRGAVVIKPDMEKYVRVGREVRALMLELTPLVEPLSIDEAFLDLAGTERLHGMPPAAALAGFARRVEREIGITVSIGLSFNKFLAKIASDLDKPRGFSIVGRADAAAFLAGKPVGIIWGVGRETQKRLAADGLVTIDDLRRRGSQDLARRYGGEGERLHRLAHGIDDRPVRPDRETKSVSAETTFDRDIHDVESLSAVLWTLSEKVARRLKRQSLAGCSVTLKLKAADFSIRTRSRSGVPPTQLARRIFEVGRAMLVREATGTPFRLIGIGISEFRDAAEADRGDLVDTSARREVATEAAVDSIRDRFGPGAVVRGIAFARPRT